MKIFKWLFKMYHGRVELKVPIMWTIAYQETNKIRGMTGEQLAIQGAE